MRRWWSSSNFRSNLLGCLPCDCYGFVEYSLVGCVRKHLCVGRVLCPPFGSNDSIDLKMLLFLWISVFCLRRPVRIPCLGDGQVNRRGLLDQT